MNKKYKLIKELNEKIQELQNKIDEVSNKKETPLVEFKVVEDYYYYYDNRIDAYANGDRVASMRFDNNQFYSYKIYEFNKMIEHVYKKLGIRASEEEMKDTKILKYGFSINSVIDDWGVSWSCTNLHSLTSNHSSNNIEKTKLVYDAISVHREYLKEAFGVKEKENGK